MALVSRSFLVRSKLVEILNADTDLSAVYTFSQRKLALFRGAVWQPGAFVSQLPPEESYFETQTDSIEIRSLVAIVNSAAEGSLVANEEAVLAAIERVEDIFRNKGGSDAPALLRNLNTAYASDNPNRFAFQKTTVRPADRFQAGALALGYDTAACVVNVQITVPRRDVTTLGSS